MFRISRSTHSKDPMFGIHIDILGGTFFLGQTVMLFDNKMAVFLKGCPEVES